MLGAHVLDLRKLQRAEILRLVEGVAGDVGVDMDLKGLIVLADNKAVAYAREILAQRLKVNVGIMLAHDKDRIEREGDILRVEHIESTALLLGLDDLVHVLGSGDLTAVGGEHRAEDVHIALTAGVNDSGFLEHRVLVHGLGQSVVTGLDGAVKAAFKARAGVRRFDGGSCRHARDGKDGALGGLHNGLIGCVDAVLHRTGELLCAGGIEPFEALGDAPEEQGEDNAGVAARAAEQRGSHAVRRRGYRIEFFLLKLRRGLIHSQRHIGTGIPVGHRENVEVVYRLNIGMERCVGAEYHLFEGSGVYIISQLNVPPHGMGPPMPEFLSDDRVNINVNALDRDSSGLRELIADCIHNAA